MFVVGGKWLSTCEFLITEPSSLQIFHGCYQLSLSILGQESKKLRRLLREVKISRRGVQEE